jgi:chlorobactene glucosyltransferase
MAPHASPPRIRPPADGAGPLRALAGPAAAVWAAAVALALHERRVALRAEDEPPATDGPAVSVIVPARDEARGIGATVSSLRALEYPRVEVVVVDDESRDGTLAAARAAAAGDPRVRVLAGRPLPPGWVGKPWACWQGAEAATGEWLLFTDADVVHAPDSLGRALALARRLGRGGLTLFPTVVCEGIVERTVMPAAVAAISSFVAPGPLARSARSGVAIAAGGYILVERGLYAAAGGHARIRDRLVDDVHLAAAVKRAGGLLIPARAGRLARVRMYHGGRDVWDGWSKNASFGAAGGAGRALVASVAGALTAVAPATALAEGLRRGDRRLAAAGAVGAGLQMALQRLSAWAAPTPARDAPLLPVGMLVMSAAAARGAVLRLRGAGPEWRGRRYPLAR